MNKSLEHLEKVLGYIFDHEQEDFQENPSRSHVYFHAIAFTEGEITAENIYQQILQENEDEN